MLHSRCVCLNNVVLITFISFISGTKERLVCLVVIYHSAKLMAALKKCNATLPLVTVGVLTHRGGKSKELK